MPAGMCVYVCISCIIERQRKKDQSIRHDIPGEKEGKKKGQKKSTQRPSGHAGRPDGRSVGRKEGRKLIRQSGIMMDNCI